MKPKYVDRLPAQTGENACQLSTNRVPGSEIGETDNTMNEFTARHFELLNRWKGHKRDNSNPEQNEAYQALKEAYAVTAEWASAVKERLFPSGRVEIYKRPIDQAQNFTAYNWARIYPEEHSPRSLAYTVGISADEGFMIKIDTVHVREHDRVRQAYLELRGDPAESPIVTRLSRDEGLEKTLPELVEATVIAIDNFRLTYDDVWTTLDRNHNLGDETTRTDQSTNINQQQHARVKRPSLNTILYGPPGTGKTYTTVRQCIAICDGKCPEGVDERRARYGQLMDEGRVEFVTFHQSYGYEEFVEGIRPVADAEEGAEMRLRVEAGVVKRIAERARKVPDIATTASTTVGLSTGTGLSASAKAIQVRCLWKVDFIGRPSISWRRRIRAG